jgi:hypothetical protein
MTYLKKKISPLRRAVFLDFGHKTLNKEEIAQNKEHIFQTSVRNLFPIQKYLRRCQLQKSLYPTS